MTIPLPRCTKPTDPDRAAVPSHRVGDTSLETAAPHPPDVDPLDTVPEPDRSRIARMADFVARSQQDGKDSSDARHGVIAREVAGYHATAQHERARYRVAAEEVPSGVLLDVAPPAERVTDDELGAAERAAGGLQSVIAYHSKQSDYGGTSYEHHARSQTTAETAAEFLLRLTAEVRALRGERPRATRWKALARKLWIRARAERRSHDRVRGDRERLRAEIDRLTAELAALRAPAAPDASLEARGRALGEAICAKLGPGIIAPPSYFRDTCIDMVRAVDASRLALTEEQAQIARAEPVIAAWLDYFAAMDRQHKSASAEDARIVRELRAKANGMDRLVADVVYHIALARHRASRGETGPTKPGAQ